MRDRASAQNALRAAMTGHQVWTTVHANSALAIVDRLVDLGLPMTLVADHNVVTGLISQRLVKVLCPHCKKSLADNAFQLPPAVMTRIRHALGADFSKACIVGPGCDHCGHHGTVGRSVLAEIIIPDDRFFSYIRAGEKTKATEYWLGELGGRTMLQHAIEKIVEGTVDPTMAEKVVGHLTLGPAVNGSFPRVAEVGRAN
jgi:type II secretory ATPase GspE/PulE/Tfp pilus assembly ATPase PilB-like protein